MSVTAQSPSVVLARQPICDANLDVCAYELLHRGEAVDGEQATAQVLLAACGDIGLGAPDSVQHSLAACYLQALAWAEQRSSAVRP